MSCPNKLEKVTFFTEESRKAGEDWLKDMNARTERMGSPDYWHKIYDEQCLKLRTCPLCDKVCTSQWKMDYKHRGSKECLRTQAENRGEIYTAPSKTLVQCECGKSVMFCNFPKHLDSDLHRNAMTKREVCCKICNKTFVGKRPLRDLKAHLKTRKHKKTVQSAK